MIKRYRGFESVELHDKMIVDNWNATVNKNDKVFLLGDISLEKDVSYLIKQLKGNITIVGGNHDKISHLQNYTKLDNVKGIAGIISYKGFWLTHAPLHSSELRGLRNIHGHIHDNKVRRFFNLIEDKRYFNVCVDVNDFKPVLFNNIKKLYES